MDADGLADKADEITEDVGDHPVVRTGARIGYAVNGLLHALIAWIAAQLALTHQGGRADQSGALATLAGNGLGRVLLWVAVVGFALLALWQATEVFQQHEVSDRVKAGSKAVVYLVLGWSAFSFARGSGKSSAQQSSDFTATIMDAAMGRVLVGLIGVGVVAVGAYHVFKGWTRAFLDDLRRHPGPWAVWAGRIGYAAKGVALALVGLLFITAALHNQAGESTGLDGALRSLLELPAGSIALLVIALGLAAYAVYSVARARYARV
jgi:hypothetical protein